MLSAFLWGGFAATSLLIGYLLAIRGLSNLTLGMIMGFGVGALISAIAYDLVPELMLEGWPMALAFALGAITFFVGDWIIDHQGGAERKDFTGVKEHGSGSAIFIGTLFDAVPESIVLGMGLSLGGAVKYGLPGSFIRIESPRRCGRDSQS